MSEMAMSREIASIVLCAGKGRRMRVSNTPKVCFPVAGKPAVAHLLGTLESLGVNPNILVLGHLAGMVVDEIAPLFPRALYAYQAELLGTGHAAKQGARVLEQLEFQGGVLAVAGDKVIERRALEKLFAVYESNQPDAALIVAPKDRWPTAGRAVVGDAGQVLRIIEHADLRSAIESLGTFDIAGKQVPAADIESSVRWVNQAVYLFKSEALFDALRNLRRDNVQQEEYLTDTIAYLAEKGRSVLAVPVEDPDDVLAFNNPAELIEIEEHFRRKDLAAVTPGEELDPSVFRRPSEWAALLDTPDSAVTSMLRAIYGEDPVFREEKRRRLHATVRLFIDRFGDEGLVTVIRAPGRINLMGRHVDHRGGCVNLMAIDREHVLVARPRPDSIVRARNADAGQFEDLEFSVKDLLQQVGLDRWRDFVDSQAVVKMVRDLQGNWSNYLKAPMLRLQQEFKDRQILGVDCAVSGDIPMAAGLSSSSALVVAMAEALVLTNRLGVAPHDLVDLCGEGEWFVGTRGGAGDHAAVKLSQPGRVANVGFFPFRVNEYIPFPSGYAVVICNSRIQARKAEGARQAFNERVASYELAVHLVRKRFPNYAPLIEHLRDISPDGLGIRAADVYRILLDIPEAISPEHLRAELGEALFNQITAAHVPPSTYPLRTRLLFGIAECERSKHCVRLLRHASMDQFGWLMNVSHDGDRVASADGGAFQTVSNEAFLRGRIADLHSEDPSRVTAGQLYAQPGGYACSIPEIDRMIDIALATPGVLGAQISGAGLGGCMMILARIEAVRAATDRMNELYYLPNGLEPGALPVIPIAGSGPLRVN